MARMPVWSRAVLRSLVGATTLLALSSGCGDDDVAGDASTRTDAARRDGAVETDGEVRADGHVSADADVSDATPIGDAEARDAGPPRCVAPDAPTPDWYVSATGTSDAAGTAADPLDLVTAFATTGPVRPGDRVELAAGTYTGSFESRVSGTADAPIVFAAAPGARVTIDARGASSNAALLFEGAWVEIHGLELTIGGTDRGDFVDGVEMYARNSKLVNCVIHDTSMGVGFWSTAVDSELYGNIIYNNGYEGPSRGHGHAIYTQNATGTKRLTRNILFFGYAYGIHAYTEGGSIRGFDVVDNVWFRVGASRPGSSAGGTSDGCLIGGLQPVARALLEGNESFGPSVSARSLQLGWGGSVMNEDVTLRDNFLVGRISANGAWERGTLEGNVFHSSLSGVDPADYPANEWHAALPTGSRVVVLANEHDATRADLVIYNWEEADEVRVELSDVLAEGARFEVFSVYDLWGSPVVSGTYEGGSIVVPMGTKAPPQPSGDASGITGADDPGKAFGVFVLRSSCRVSPPTMRARVGG